MSESSGDNSLLESYAKELASVRTELYSLREENARLKFSWEMLNTPEQCHFYTGLPKIGLFSALFSFVTKNEEKEKENTMRKLSLKDELFMVLVKLKLNLHYDDLGQRMSVDGTTVSRIVHKWIDLLFPCMKKLVDWPAKDSILNTLPDTFFRFNRNVRCIIDCTEFFIERPSSFNARSKTWSNYKHHNTVKCLIGMCPQGVITFISKCYGGRISDKEITNDSGFLDKLDHGDVILADRGFLVREEFAVRGASLIIPAFTKGHKQLPPSELDKSRAMARVRVHVERIIGVLKRRYGILEGPIPISLVKKTDTVYATLDKIMVICAGLVNLGNGIVPATESG